MTEDSKQKLYIAFLIGWNDQAKEASPDAHFLCHKDKEVSKAYMSGRYAKEIGYEP